MPEIYNLYLLPCQPSWIEWNRNNDVRPHTLQRNSRIHILGWLSFCLSRIVTLQSTNHSRIYWQYQKTANIELQKYDSIVFLRRCPYALVKLGIIRKKEKCSLVSYILFFNVNLIVVCGVYGWVKTDYTFTVNEVLSTVGINSTTDIALFQFLFCICFTTVSIACGVWRYCSCRQYSCQCCCCQDHSNY